MCCCYFNQQLQLQEKNEQLYTRLEEMRAKYSELMNSKTQLSSKLISSEEEKLKVSASTLSKPAGYSPYCLLYHIELAFYELIN